MRLLIIEQPLNNRGDEAAHRGLIRALLNRYPDLTIDVMFYGRKQRDIDFFQVPSERVHYLNIPIKNHRIFSVQRVIKLVMMLRLPFLLNQLPLIRKVLFYYKSVDCIMCAPGGINLGGFQDWSHVAFLYLAVKTGKPVIYFARSIGPFSENSYLSRIFKKLSLKLLNSFSYISLRDALSQTIAKQLNIKFVPTVDSAFLSIPNIELPEDIVKKLSDNYIVVVPNSLTWHKDFKEFSYDFVKKFWSELLNTLLNKYSEAQIVMLPQTIGYSKMLADGFVYFNEIKQMAVFSERVFVLDEQYGSDIQQMIIKNAKFLIGARYHSIIFAINQSVPFVSLSYEHKMTGVLNCLALQQNELLIKNLLESLYCGRLSISEGIQQILSKVNPDQNLEPQRELANTIAVDAFQKLDNYFVK